MDESFDLYRLLQEIRNFLIEFSGEELVLRSTDLPQQLAIAFAATKGQIIQKHWLIKIRNLAVLSEVERFILSSIPGRELLAKYISDFTLDLSLAFEKLYPSCIDEVWVDLLKEIEQKEATEVSKKLLVNLLHTEQQKTFQNVESFFVFPENEKFLLTKDGYYSFDEKDHPKWGFCIHTSDWLPVYDRMLSIKLLLESNLPLFYALANKRELSFKEKLRVVLTVGQMEYDKSAKKSATEMHS